MVSLDRFCDIADSIIDITNSSVFRNITKINFVVAQIRITILNKWECISDVTKSICDTTNSDFPFKFVE